MNTALVVGIATFLLTTAGWLLLLNLTLGNKKIDERIETEYSVADSQFRRVMGSLLGPPLVDGNRVQALLNGAEIFPAMLGAIRNAQRSITFETYIYWSGTIGEEFADALIERARAGVRVHVLLDWWGSGGIEDLNLKKMQAAGIEVRRYNPLSVAALGRMNNRTHRKLLVVDGRIGFTGGVGIADPWRGHAQDPQHWRDTHFRVEGPVITQMQSAFLDNWIAVTGHVLHGPAYLPPIEPPVRIRRRYSPALRAAAPKACSSCTSSRSPRPEVLCGCRWPISFPTTSRSTPLWRRVNAGFACR